MNIFELKKEIKGVFKPPVKRYYLGRLRHGTPYFFPRNSVSTILYIRKLKLRTEEELKTYSDRYPYLVNHQSGEFRFSNMPMVRRSKDWVIKLFGNWYYIEVGYPIAIRSVELGWKDKFESPRFEWVPQFTICFFNLQFCIWWNAPIDGNNDKYYEMILWYLRYCDKDIVKAKETWDWVDVETKLSTWDNKYLINEV